MSKPDASSRLTCPTCDGACEVVTAEVFEPDEERLPSLVPTQVREAAVDCAPCKGTGRRCCEDCGKAPADVVVDQGRIAVCARCLAEVARAEADREVLERAAHFREVLRKIPGPRLALILGGAS